MSDSSSHSDQDIDMPGSEQARLALGAMRQRLVELDGWTWEANYEMVAHELHRVTELEETLRTGGLLRNDLVEQLETYRAALGEAHDQLCGCDRPTNSSACVAPQETWGAFALLADSNPASTPKSTDSPFPQPALESTEKGLFRDREIPGKPANHVPANKPKRGITMSEFELVLGTLVFAVIATACFTYAVLYHCWRDR